MSPVTTFTAGWPINIKQGKTNEQAEQPLEKLYRWPVG
jgi:hypothetical protein